MKTKDKTLERSKGRHLPFVLVCLLIAGAGGAVKIAVDHVERLQDDFMNGFNRPSQVYLWTQLERQRKNSSVLPQPAKSAIETGQQEELSLSEAEME